MVKLVGEISSFWSWWCCFEGWRFFGIERGHKWVICYSDSAQLVQLVNHEMRPLHDYRDEVKKVKDHMGRDWLCQVQHSFCEGNACVDDLTRMGVTIGGSWTLFGKRSRWWLLGGQSLVIDHSILMCPFWLTWNLLGSGMVTTCLISNWGTNHQNILAIMIFSVMSLFCYMNEVWPPPSGIFGLNSICTIKKGQCLKLTLWNIKECRIRSQKTSDDNKAKYYK